MTIPFDALRKRWRADPAYRDADFEMDLAFAMAEARHRSALSQAEVAERVGTSQAMVARWETGRSPPTTIALRRFAEATGAKLKIVFETNDVTCARHPAPQQACICPASPTRHSGAPIGEPGIQSR